MSTQISNAMLVRYGLVRKFSCHLDLQFKPYLLSDVKPHRTPTDLGEGDAFARLLPPVLIGHGDRARTVVGSSASHALPAKIAPLAVGFGDAILSVVVGAKNNIARL